MMKKNSKLQILLVVIVLMAASLACVGGADKGNANLQSNSNHSAAQGTQAVSATATYGAKQFQIQLTAIADQNQP
jgi:hypothetical protein